MARYTSLFKVVVPIDRFQELLIDSLQSCSLDVIYTSEDYWMAREIPGHVSYAQLVTVEVLIEQAITRDTEVTMSFVVKNEELPLQANNHCRQVFNLVNQVMTENRQWCLIEGVAT